MQFRNESGVEPLDLRVVVMTDPAERVSKGGIIIPTMTAEREEYAITKATLVAVGANAWSEATRKAGFFKPEPGARVMIAKYGGVLFDGPDGKKYRIMNDEDVIGLLTMEEDNG